MDAEKENCQNCKIQFTIEPDDFDFYAKVKVPPPTFCWLCRAERRLAWRNERNLYKRKSDYSGKEIFSMYAPEVPVKVYEKEVWNSDAWDALEYGRAYDFSRPFFEQFRELLYTVPLKNLNVVNGVRSDYSNNFTDPKNCYLCFNGNSTEDTCYGNGLTAVKDCVDVSHLGKSEGCYECFWMTSCNRCFFSSRCESSYDIWFSTNCVGCHDCVGCAGLRKKSYCIWNEQYSKEEYEELVQKILAHMDEMPFTDSKGRIYRYGEFFPIEFSPIAYNQSVAQEYFALTESEANAKGYGWRDPADRNYKITLPSTDLPDSIQTVQEGIIHEIIGCAHEGTCAHQCTAAFRIIPQEFQFYRKINIPLPRLCPNCRHGERIAQRNKFVLYERQCDCEGKEGAKSVYKNLALHSHGEGKCPNRFETTYSPEQEDIVYCEACYNSEIA